MSDLEKTLIECCKILRIETLETRKSDRLDFKEVAVWNVKQALEMAYEAGRKSVGKQ
jgi:hypothetical protein